MNTSRTTRKIYPRLMRRDDMAIYTSRRQTTRGRASYISTKSRAPYLSYAYEGLKYAGKTYGFYKDIEPYLPETYLDKYRYKPHKRVAGYLGQYAYGQKIQRRIPQSKTGYQQYKERIQRSHRCTCGDKHIRVNRKGSQYSSKYSYHRRFTGLSH